MIHSLDLSCNGRFMHLAPYSTSSACTSPGSSISHQLSPSTSPSSLDEGTYSPTSAKFLSSLSAASSTLSYCSSPRSVSVCSSTTSVDLTSPCNGLESDLSLDAYETPRRINPAATVALKHASNLQRQACSAPALPKEQLQNPRRTRRLLENQDGNPVGLYKEPQLCPPPPPPLVRQADRKVNFVDNLVDTAAQIVEAIWPSSMMQKSCEPSLGRVLPLRTFIQETLRRSRTSYSTLQVALYYLFVIRAFIPVDEASLHVSDSCQDIRALQCGRRMFLAALILASKYLQDRNYSARAWSKISGLNISEINANELAFLTTVNWKLHISDHIFDRWTKIVLKCTPTTSILPAKASVHCGFPSNKWVPIFTLLNGSLDLLTLEDMLGQESLSVPCSESKLATLQTLGSQISDASVPSFAVASEPGKINSMAFALAAPMGGRGVCNESMPPRSCDERVATRCSRKSSLSVCETLQPSEMGVSTVDSSVSTCSSGTLRNLSLSDNYMNANLPRSSEKLAIVIDPRQQMNASSRGSAHIQVPAGHLRPESRRVASASPAVGISVSGKNRKRGNETPVASRHQKKQKDRLGDFDAPKVSDVVPSGLTPQMRQMGTNFSISGKKGNGLRMNLNPGFTMSASHGQIMRPGTGQRSMGHVVYG